MAGYTKLFSDIVDSSVWEEPPEICKVWVTLLALSDMNGYVRGSIGWLAGKARVSVELCQQAVHKFLSPDPKSRTKDNDGRRIQEVERGWIILNHEYYRNEHGQLSTEPRAIYKREWMRKKRATESKSTGCPQKSTKVHTASASESDPDQEGGLGETTEMFHKDSRTALHLLNEATARKFRELDSNLAPISARLSEPGVTLEGVRLMIARQVKMWGGTEMERYLQPSTLFGKQKFDNYYSAREMPISNLKPSSPPSFVQIKALEEEIARHTANPESVFHNRACSPELKTDLRTKRDRLREWHALLAGGVKA